MNKEFGAFPQDKLVHSLVRDRRVRAHFAFRDPVQYQYSSAPVRIESRLHACRNQCYDDLDKTIYHYRSDEYGQVRIKNHYRRSDALSIEEVQIFQTYSNSEGYSLIHGVSKDVVKNGARGDGISHGGNVYEFLDNE